MEESQSTWKDRVEEYKRAEGVWRKGRKENLEKIVQICKETSIPALEAGLLALVPLAEGNKLEEYTKDVIDLAMKQVSSTKPTTKRTTKSIIEALSRTHPEKVVSSAVGQLRDKNPKVIAETLKTLQEESESLWKSLFEGVLPHTEFLFSHSAGSVREEATKVYQKLARKDEERVREAVQELKPIIIKEILSDTRNEREDKRDERREVKGDNRDTRDEKKEMRDVREMKEMRNEVRENKKETIREEKNTASRISNINSQNSQKNQNNQSMQNNKNTQTHQMASSHHSTSSHHSDQKRKSSSQSKDGMGGQSGGGVNGHSLGEKKVVGLPGGFFEKIVSAQWKERLVMEELDSRMGNPQTGTLSKEDTQKVVGLILKRVSENNNKVFVSSMSVLKKLLVSHSIGGGLVRDSVKIVGKRLKDKNAVVYQSVVQVLVDLFGVYRVLVLEEVADLLRTEKSSRVRSLQALSEIAGGLTQEEALTAQLLSNLVESTRDQSADVRALACAVLGQVLYRRGETPTQEEIEGLGIERLLAAKVEEAVTECAKQKEEEMDEIVDSLCEDIRNTTITQNPSLIMTPIKERPSLRDIADMTSSPIITQERKEYLPVVAHYSEEHTDGSLLRYILEGELRPEETAFLIGMLGEDSEKDERIIGVLQHTRISEEEAQNIRDKIENLSPNRTPQAKVSIEALRGKIGKILGEKSLFEEKCMFAALLERLTRKEAVSEEEILSALGKQIERGGILQEEEARVIITRAAEEGMHRAAEKLDSVFPVSKTLSLCIELAEKTPSVLNIILPLIERCKLLPHFPVGEYLGNTQFISFLEQQGSSVAARILFLLRGYNSIDQIRSSPYIKRTKSMKSEETDVNSLLNDIIDQDAVKARESLERLEEVAKENPLFLVGSASTLVNVLLLQLNDSLSSGVPSHPNTDTIIRILKQTCSCEKFLEVLDAGTLLGLTSDLVCIVTGQIPKGATASETVRKECGETLLKICTCGPCASVFKVYMTLLCNGHKEEKLREVLVKLIWKHSKVCVSSLGDKKTVLGLIASLNTFYLGFRGDLKTDPLITKVLQLHLIEMLKHYGEEFVSLFKVTGPILHQAKLLIPTTDTSRVDKR